MWKCHLSDAVPHDSDALYLKAVKFPEYVPEYNYETKEMEIIPLFTPLGRPTAGTDYSITGQDILAGLCNLYKKVNAPDYSGDTTN